MVYISTGKDDCFKRCELEGVHCKCASELIQKVKESNERIAALNGGNGITIFPIVLADFDETPVSQNR